MDSPVSPVASGSSIFGSQEHALQLLDLRQCHSIADIVTAMSRCSFGARMLGEVTTTISDWIQSHRLPLVIYDGKLTTSFGQLLLTMVKRQWFAQVISPRAYAEGCCYGQENVIVIGAYSERYAAAIEQKPQAVIFVNAWGLATPGQTQDGYYPNVVFSDPRFIMPTIFTSLDEILEQRKTTITDFVAGLKYYGGLAEEVHHGATTVLQMINDPDCTVFLTLSGAMTIAKMGWVICDLIELGMVQGICSTGALMAHGLIESVGLQHFKYHPQQSDVTLAGQQLNRVSDTLEPERNLDHMELIIRKILDDYCLADSLSPRQFHQMIGEYLTQHYPHQRGILKSAYEKKVPIFVPAFVDSEIGNDVYVHNWVRKQQGRSPIRFDLEKDTEFLLDFVVKAKKLGIFTIGGGVPRNYIQNIAPVIDVMNQRQLAQFPVRKFAYGCRICPDPMHYGHLSGCTYSEGISWRKMEASGRFSEIHADATLIWPFLVKYVMEVAALTK